ncbi:MAG: aldo/keto reductase [Candidatus Omnitrophica bacterium]|nr:aldo/keto reductase [Candidatus Omnitrophota bacterium]
MQYRQLGRTDLEISRITFGCWAIGGWWWGTVDDSESIAAIRAAAEDGINFFDTADVYGGGRSETVLGKALEGIDNVYVATKGGVQFDENWATDKSNDPGYLKKACEASLKRLNREVIDLYQIHWPDEGKTPIDVAIEGLQELKEEGKIRYFGLSNFGESDLEVALDTARYESVQPKYNLLHREIEEDILPFCEDNEIGVLAYSPLASGLLTGKFTEVWEFEEGDHRKDHPDFTGEAFKKNLAIVEVLKEYAEKRECTIAQLAIAWTLANPAVTSAICGAKKDMQVDELVEAIDFPLKPKEIEEINAIVTSLS